MSRELIITSYEHGQKNYVLSCLKEEGNMVEVRLDPPEKDSLVGNIYLGQVDQVLPNIQGAFVRIANGLVCYLNTKDSVKQGQQLLVQVTKDAINQKAPCVSTNLNMTGRYLVLTTENTRLGISSKLSKEEQTVLRNWLEPEKPENIGVIARTAAIRADKEELLQEYGQLKKKLDKILLHGYQRTCYSLLYESDPAYISFIRDAGRTNLDRIVTDQKEVYEVCREYLSEYQPADLEKLQYYEDPDFSLSALHSLSTFMKKLLQEKVWLDCGGYLVIQQTEAFVTVDVNSGKCTGGKKKAQETYRKINLEAAKEIAAQLRLRNLSGIILIDFINLERKEHQEELTHVLAKHLRKDPVRAQVIDITKLNIVEVTRQRSHKSVAAILQDSFQKSH